MGIRVYFNNDGQDYEDGLRLMTEGEICYCGRYVCTVGVYAFDDDSHAYIRQQTVRIPTGRARSFSPERLRTLVEQRQAELEVC